MFERNSGKFGIVPSLVPQNIHTQRERHIETRTCIEKHRAHIHWFGYRWHEQHTFIRAQYFYYSWIYRINPSEHLSVWLLGNDLPVEHWINAMAERARASASNTDGDVRQRERANERIRSECGREKMVERFQNTDVCRLCVGVIFCVLSHNTHTHTHTPAAASEREILTSGCAEEESLGLIAMPFSNDIIERWITPRRVYDFLSTQ